MAGLTRGLQLIADWMKLLLAAAAKANAEALSDAYNVAKVWLGETVNEAGVVTINPLALLFGADPWKLSRKAFQDFAAKWKGKL